MTQNTGAFEALLQEDRTYPPPAEFAANANIADPGVYEEALRDPEAFWARFAGELDWFKPWDTVLDWSDAPFAKWFVGGKLNAAYNCRSNLLLICFRCEFLPFRRVGNKSCFNKNCRNSCSY